MKKIEYAGCKPLYSSDGNYILDNTGKLPDDPPGWSYRHVYLMNVNTGNVIKKWDLKGAGSFVYYWFTKDNRYFYMQASNNPLQRWDLNDLSISDTLGSLAFTDLSLDNNYFLDGLDLYRLTIDGIAPQMAMNKQNKINSIYPNPNSNELNVNFTLAKYGSTKIAITDMEGKEIKIIFEEYFEADEHIITCNASDLQNGVYYLNIKQNNSIISEKFIISK